tara:strand:- start:95 stop:520 length:426 start_codon:yes stop_codon:yes gene_type:complete
MACNDISNICVNPILATCVDFEGSLGVNTKITDSCVNQNDVNGDLYAITDEIIEGLDNSTLTSTCITIPVNSTTAEIIALYEAKICELDEEVTTLQNIDYSQLDITGWGLTIPACIVDPCAIVPTTLGPLLQVIMDQRNCI